MLIDPRNRGNSKGSAATTKTFDPTLFRIGGPALPTRRVSEGKRREHVRQPFTLAHASGWCGGRVLRALGVFAVKLFAAENDQGRRLVTILPSLIDSPPVR